jgi:hypothetical protein
LGSRTQLDRRLLSVLAAEEADRHAVAGLAIRYGSRHVLGLANRLASDVHDDVAAGHESIRPLRVTGVQSRSFAGATGRHRLYKGASVHGQMQIAGKLLGDGGGGQP